MRQHKHGQSIVEMAFIFPLLVVVLFGIIDLSWYIYGYATVYQSSRNAAEAAAQLPPYTERLALRPNANWLVDPCVQSILTHAAYGTEMFPGIANAVTIRYPAGTLSTSRAIGSQIEVDIAYQIQPLTPLFQLVALGNNGVLNAQVTTRRTIESLGHNPNYENGIACSKP